MEGIEDESLFFHRDDAEQCLVIIRCSQHDRRKSLATFQFDMAFGDLSLDARPVRQHELEPRSGLRPSSGLLISEEFR